MVFELTDGAKQTRLLTLNLILFLSYLCVGISLPVAPVFVARELGLNNIWAGSSVGIAFLSTILTRGQAGSFSDRRGPKRAVAVGLSFIAGALISIFAGLCVDIPPTAYTILIIGRIMIGFGESLVAVGVIGWGIGLVGPEQSGQVLALVGAALYGALGAGGPVGLLLFERIGFSGAMLVSLMLPAIGLLAIWRIPDVAVHPEAQRPSFLTVIRKIWLHGAVVCLQGIGFAVIGAFFSLYFADRGWPWAGMGLSAFAAGFVLVRIFFGHLPDRIGGLPVAICSLAIEMVGQLVIWLSPNPGFALVGAFLTGVGCSMVFPSMGREVVRLVAPHLRGTALGGFSAFQDLAYGLAGPGAGLLADIAGYPSVFLAGCVSSALGLIIAIVLRIASSRTSPQLHNASGDSP